MAAQRDVDAALFKCAAFRFDEHEVEYAVGEQAGVGQPHRLVLATDGKHQAVRLPNASLFTKSNMPSANRLALGSRTAWCLPSVARKATRANISGFSFRSGLATAQRTWMRRVTGSSVRPTRSTVAGNCTPG